MSTPDSDIKASIAATTARARVRFVRQYSNADRAKFTAQVEADEKTSALKYFSSRGLFHFKAFLVPTNEKYAPVMEKAVAGLCYQLLLRQTRTALPIPVANFTEAAPSLNKWSTKSWHLRDPWYPLHDKI